MTQARETAEITNDVVLGTGSTQVPTNDDLSTSILGTVTFSSDTYTFDPTGTTFPELRTGTILRFKLPADANTTTSPSVDYDGTSYDMKWIDGTSFAAGDLDDTYNKQILEWYFDGTDLLLTSSISGSDGTNHWVRDPDGIQAEFYTVNPGDCTAFGSGTLADPYRTATISVTFQKTFQSEPDVTLSPINNGGSGADRAITVSAATVSTTAISNLQAYRTSDSSDTTDVYIKGLAKGRWY